MVTWQDVVLAALAISLLAWGAVRLYWYFFDRPSKEAVAELRRRREEAKVKRAIEALEKGTKRLDVLGSYAKADPVV